MRKGEHAWLATVIPVIVFGLVAVPIIALDYGGPTATGAAKTLRAADDQNRYHLVAIDEFATALPHVDVSDYPSATTPGYHLLLAVCKRAFNLDSQGLRAFAAIFTIGLLVALGAALGARVGWVAGALMALPVALSLYVISSGAWLLPDNAAWWAALTIALLALSPKQNVVRWALAGALLLALVLIRQSHIWAAAVVWTGAWLGPVKHEHTTDESDARLWPCNRADWIAALRRTALAFACTAPAGLALAWFFYLWGGVTPPMFQTNLERINPATPGLALALLGVYTVFYGWFVVVAVRSGAQSARRRIWFACAIGAFIGLAVGTVPVSTYCVDAGRFSGLWNVVRIAPVIAERSLLFIAMTTWGGICAGAWFAVTPWRSRWVLSAAFVAFVIAMSVNAMAWQRYLEPMLLMLVALAAAETCNRRRADEERSRVFWMLIGPFILTVLQGLVAARGLL